MKKKRCNLLLFCLITGLSSSAQIDGWHYQATIDSIKEAGFYNIVLTPEISAHLKTDYSDLRIVNESGKWVPHLLREPNNEQSTGETILDLPVIKKENTTAFTELVVQNKITNISNLLLKLRNTDAERYGTLTGSDDSNNWFIINDSILIKPVRSVVNTTEFNIEFPTNNYKFFKLTINNRGKAPFNIDSISTHFHVILSVDPGSLFNPIENPATTIQQKDSGKLSYLRVIQSAHCHFDELHLKPSGVKYFSRAVDLYIPQLAPHSFNDPGQLIKSFTISNNSTLQFMVPITNADTFYLIIHNEDNLPLRLDKVKTYNSYRVVTAYLENGSNYKLIMGNTSATTPNYDLQQLNFSNRQLLPTIAVGAITAIQQSSAAISTNNNKWLIWLTIGIAALVLAFFTYRLSTEMNKSKA